MKLIIEQGESVSRQHLDRLFRADSPESKERWWVSVGYLVSLAVDSRRPNNKQKVTWF